MGNDDWFYSRGIPQWSSDGNLIVFDKYDPKKRAAINIVRSDGSELKKISAGSGDSEADYWPDISPDGSRVVYSTSRHRTKLNGNWRRNFEIETSKLDGSDRRRLTYNGVSDFSPAWSPDGRGIAFYTSQDYDKVVVMATDGPDKRIIFDARTVDPGTFDLEKGAIMSGMMVRRGPVWSPEGEMLSFVGSTNFGKELVGPENPSTRIGTLSVVYSVEADGEGLAPLFVASSVEDFTLRAMAWSPDGRELAFMHHDANSGERGEWILYAIGHDGSGLRKVSELDYRGRFSSLSWSPNGDEILVVSDGDLYVAKADGSGYREVAQAPYASWSPDGSRIAISGGSGFYLTTIAADGSDEQVLVYEYTDSSLGAANPEPKKCFLWICW